MVTINYCKTSKNKYKTMDYKNFDCNGGHNVYSQFKPVRCSYYWRPVQKQEAQPLKQQQQYSSNSNSTAASTVEEEVQGTVIHPSLLSFLEKDSSFLTPWSWDPKATSSSSKETKQFLQFQPGSYFVIQVFDYYVRVRGILK